ncbi:MAG: VOC family protein [Xanthomonadales bacterium]|nr:VOC family protein [Xanthomonadales bacterium]
MSSGHTDAPGPVLDRVHHLAFITADLDQAVARFERLLGVAKAERGPVAGRGAEVVIFKLANLNLEVVSPVRPDSPLHDHLARHGEGFFHLAFAVDDVDAACDQLQARGVNMKSRPRRAYKDWRVAYIDSELTSGIAMHIINADAE